MRSRLARSSKQAAPTSSSDPQNTNARPKWEREGSRRAKLGRARARETWWDAEELASIRGLPGRHRPAAQPNRRVPFRGSGPTRNSCGRSLTSTPRARVCRERLAETHLSGDVHGVRHGGVIPSHSAASTGVTAKRKLAGAEHHHETTRREAFTRRAACACAVRRASPNATRAPTLPTRGKRELAVIPQPPPVDFG